MPKEKSDNRMNRAWIKRALDPKNPSTKDRESVRTMSVEIDGKEILFPSIRMIGGKLTPLTKEAAIKLALSKKDYITFDSPEEATAFSKRLSNKLGEVRRKSVSAADSTIRAIRKKK